MCTKINKVKDQLNKTGFNEVLHCKEQMYAIKFVAVMVSKVAISSSPSSSVIFFSILQRLRALNKNTIENQRHLNQRM
jgi:hypothetical protein